MWSINLSCIILLFWTWGFSLSWFLTYSAVIFLPVCHVFCTACHIAFISVLVNDSVVRRLLLRYLTSVIKKYPKKLNFHCIKQTDWGILVHFWHGKVGLTYVRHLCHAALLLANDLCTSLPKEICHVSDTSIL